MGMSKSPEARSWDAVAGVAAGSARLDSPQGPSPGWEKPRFARRGEDTGGGKRPPPHWNSSNWNNEGACKLSLVLTHRDTSQLAILVDDVFNLHNNIFYAVDSKLELLGIVTTISRESGLWCHL